MKKTLICFVIIFVLSTIATPVTAQIFTVCAIGDSHVERNSLLLRELQSELGTNYIILARGRRGWTSQRWLDSGDFGISCEGADIVLISLGGNDVSHRVSQSRTFRNIELLIQQLPPYVFVVYHMEVPRFFLESRFLARDGIHLNRTGARYYASVIAQNLHFK